MNETSRQPDPQASAPQAITPGPRVRAILRPWIFGLVGAILLAIIVERILVPPRRGIQARRLAAMAAVGQAAPEFALPDEQSLTVRLSDFRGRPVVVNFLCGCAACRVLSALERARIQNRHASAVVILAITDMEPEVLPAFREGAPDPNHWLLSRDVPLKEAYQARVCPRTWVIDADGVARYTHAATASPREIVAGAEAVLATIAPPGREQDPFGLLEGERPAAESGRVPSARMEPATGMPLPADPRLAILEAYRRMNSAFIREDPEGSVVHLSPDFVESGPGEERRTLAEVRSALATIFAVSESIRSTTTVQQLRVQGSRAKATVRRRRRILAINPEAPIRQAGHVVTDETARESWVRSGGRWLLVRSEVVACKRTLDGQRLPGG